MFALGGLADNLRPRVVLFDVWDWHGAVMALMGGWL